MSGRLALFDLDNTLLSGDSDHAWGEFLIAQKIVDEDSHRAENDRFYQQYQQGVLDIHAYVEFTLAPILTLSSTERDVLHSQFMEEAIQGLILDEGLALVDKHRDAGDFCVIITATNEFITGPIAAKMHADALLATALEINEDRFTGRIEGIACYQEGKVKKLEQWLLQSDMAENFSIDESTFYSDSINDLPLLQRVGKAVAVDPDDALRQQASDNHWEVISLRSQ